MFTFIKRSVLAALRATSEKYADLVEKYDDLEVEHKTMTVEYATLQRRSSQIFRLIAGTQLFFERLTAINGPATNEKTTAGAPTHDGTGWAIDFGSMDLVIVFGTDEIHLVDHANNVPTGIFSLTAEGTISAATQTSMLGHADRIVRASAPEGFDPVTEATSLIGEVATA